MFKLLSSYFISLVRDACHKAFWHKRPLASFLRQHHIPEKYITPLFQGETKAEVLSRIFDGLAVNQTAQKQTVIFDIANDLVGMETFPDLECCDDPLTKIKEAQKAIAVLRAQFEKLKVSYLDTGDETAKRKAKEKRDAGVAYESQFNAFAERLNDIARRAGQSTAGFDFEQWIYDFALFNDLEARKSFKDKWGRQIDGALTIDGDTMLVEAKCTAQPISVGEIDSFRAKIETKADNTLGLMISMAGYETGAIQAASLGRTPFILMDGRHLFNLVMPRRASFKDVISRIKRNAAQTGCPYLPPTDF